MPALITGCKLPLMDNNEYHRATRRCPHGEEPTPDWAHLPALLALHRRATGVLDRRYVRSTLQRYFNRSGATPCWLPLPTSAGDVPGVHEPPGMYVAAALAVYAQLPAAMGSRTLLFLGDSLSMESMLQMADVIGGMSGGLQSHPHKDHACIAWPNGFRLCHLGVSRDLAIVPRQPRLTSAAPCYGREWATITSMLLDDVLRWCLQPLGYGPRDVVVVSVGVHHNTPSQTLLPEVEGLGKWLAHTKPDSRPCLLWREALPQNFQTEDGTFGGFLAPHTCELATASASASASVSASAAHHVANWCAPLPTGFVERGSRQKYNDLTTPVLEGLLPIIRMFRAATPFWELHAECLQEFDKHSSKQRMTNYFGASGKAADCTHYPAPSPVHYMAHLLLFTVLEERCGVKWGR